MRPLSDKAFLNLDSYIVQIDEVVHTNLLTKETISSFTNREEMCVDDVDNLVEDGYVVFTNGL